MMIIINSSLRLSKAEFYIYTNTDRHTHTLLLKEIHRTLFKSDLKTESSITPCLQVLAGQVEITHDTTTCTDLGSKVTGANTAVLTFTGHTCL